MRRVVVVLSALALLAGGLTVVLATTSNGHTKTGPRPGVAAKPATAPKAHVRTITVPHVQAVPYGTCYAGAQSCSIRGCTQYVSPQAQPVAAPAVAQAPVVVPSHSTRCVSTPAQKTRLVGNSVVTPVYVGPAAGP